VKRFSDFAAETNAMTGDKIKIEDVLGKEIEVMGYKVANSKYPKSPDSKVLTLQFNLDGVSRILFTGSRILLEQCEQYENELPFCAKIEKVNKYYTFS
jgi:hypothetical protein